MSKPFTPRLENQLGQKLRHLLPGFKPKSDHMENSKNPMPAPTGKDGEDHINIWDRASTPLGKLLANRTELKFAHDIFGNFSNIEAFWYYIRSQERDDRIRSMSGEAVRSFASKLTAVRVPNFKAIIMDTNWQKIKQYPELMQTIKESELPFECYYYYKRSDGVRIRPSFACWLIQGFDEIRRALKEDREPNFDSLKDNKKIGIYDAVLPTVDRAVEGNKPSKKQKKAVKANEPAQSAEAQLGALLSNSSAAAVATAIVSADSIAADVAPVEVQEAPAQASNVVALVQETPAPETSNAGLEQVQYAAG